MATGKNFSLRAQPVTHVGMWAVATMNFVVLHCLSSMRGGWCRARECTSYLRSR